MATFASLRERNYALFFAGQCLSLVGTWTEKPALQALVYELTHDVRWLGWIGVIPIVPTLLVSIPAGALVERVDPRRVVIWTQTLMMAGAGAMAMVVYLGGVRPWHCAAYTFWSSGVFAVDAAARQSLLVLLVPRERLTNAVALNASMFSVARFAGGFVFAAVILYTDLGKGGCIALNALSFGFVLVGLFLMRLPAVPRDAAAARPDPWEGLRYAARTPEVRAALLVVVMLSLFGFQVSHLLVVYAHEVWESGDEGLGWLHAAAGLGALIGSLHLARRSVGVHRGRLVMRYMVAAPVFLAVFALAPTLWAGAAALALGGFVMTQAQSSCNALLQHTVPDGLRGRVMSLYTMAVLASFPLGALFAGYAGEWFGVRATTIGNAVLILVAVATIRATHPSLRQTR